MVRAVLTPEEVGQYNASGFVIIKQCLSQDEFGRLEAAYERVMPTAPEHNYFDECGTKMMNPFVEADDSMGELVEHPKIMKAMRDIWGIECLYSGGSDMWSNYSETPWHSDGDPGREAVSIKTAIYLDKTTTGKGSLNVIPGSHHPAYSAAIFDAWGCSEEGRPRLTINRDAIPGIVSVDTSPGDVVIFDTRIWHSAPRRNDGLPRRTMFISYLPDPKDVPLTRERRNAIKERLESGNAYIYSKEMLRKKTPERERMAARLEALGVDRVREP